jgi:putative inorganic carbon (hco3(-)) transporter
MIVVSLKQFVAQLWFITSYYFVVLHILKEKKNIKYIIWAYASGLIIVCIYTIINHALHGFTHKAGHWVMNPFYKDHTSYGAVLALVIPAIIGLKSIARKDININFFLLDYTCIFECCNYFVIY